MKMKNHYIYQCKGLAHLHEIVAKKEAEGYEVCGLSENNSFYTVIFKRFKIFEDDNNKYNIPDRYQIPYYVPSPSIPDKGWPNWTITCMS